MDAGRHRWSGQSAPKVWLVEPDINPISRRLGLPIVANYPPLSLARLAGQLPDGTARIIDLRVPGEWERFRTELAHDPPALIGVSLTFTSNGAEAIRVARFVRETSPGTTIVLGGMAASEDIDAFLDEPFDLICHRAGDRSLPRLVEELEKTGRVPERPAGFHHRAGGTWGAGPACAPPPLDSLRPYAWHLIPRRYWRTYVQGLRLTGMSQTSEGCPYDCNFCAVWQVHGRRVDLVSLDNIKHDFLSLPPGVKGFFFADDIWLQASEAQLRGLHDPLFEWLAGEFIPRRRDVWLTVETRTDLFLRQIGRFEAWIERANLKRIFFGVEGVTDEALRGFSKRNTVDKNSEAIRKAAEMGVKVVAQLVLPLDATRAYFDEVVRFLEAHRRWIAVVNFTIATPLPGTDLYRETVARYPDLADRSKVVHPAFSLFTALAPTAMHPIEFYEQVARLYRAARGRFRWNLVPYVLGELASRPGLLSRALKIPRLVRDLRRAATWIDVHRAVQGERLLAPEVPEAGIPEIRAARSA